MRIYLTLTLSLSVSALLWCQPSGLEEAAQCQNRAASQLLSGNFEEAIGQLETAASLYASAQEWEYYFSCLNQVTNAYLDLGQVEEAKRTAKKALWESIRRLGRDNDEAAKAAHRLAEVYSRAGRHAKAIEVHKMGLMIRESIYGSRHTQVADSYDWIAAAWAAAADYGQAADYYERAMSLRRELLGPRHPDVAISCTHLANLELARENYTQALAYYQEAYDISRNRLGEKHPDVAAALASMASANRLLGNRQLAEQQYREAALLYRQNPDAKGARAAEAFHELAVQYFNDGNLDGAAGFARRAVQALALSQTDGRQRAHQYYQSLGAILAEKGQYKEAAGSFRQALASKADLSADDYQQWSEALRLSGSLPEALGAATAFLEWAEGQPDPYAMLSARTQMGRLLIETGRVEEGVRQIARVLNHDDTPFWLLQEANHCLADAYLRKGEYDKAIQQYKLLAEEWKKSHQAGAAFFLFRALLSLGNTHSDLARQDRNTLYNLEAALNTFETCDKVLFGLLRSPLPSEHLLFISGAQQKLYSDAIRACYSLYQQNREERHLRLAFYFSERSKQLSGRLPLMLLPPASFARAPQALLKQEAENRRAVQLLFGSLRNNRLNEEATDSIQNQIEEKETEYRSLLARLEREAPDYYRLKFGSEVVEPEELSTLLQQQSAALYAYYLTDEGLYTFYFTGKGFQLFWWPLDEAFRTSLHDFLQMVFTGPGESLSNNLEATYRQATALAVQLHEKLLPGKPELPGQPLFLLPHGLLQWLPFEALLPSAPPNGTFANLPYLGLNHSISYHSSATALKDALESSDSQEYESRYEAFVFAGDDNQAAMKGAFAMDKEDAAPLNYFLDFVRDWAAETNGRLWESPLAGESVFRGLPPAEVMLLALPAQAGPLPDDTFLCFSEKADSLFDNRLYLREIYGLEKPVGLYILASARPLSPENSGWQELAEALRYSRGQSLLFHRWPAAGPPSVEMLQLFRSHWQATGSVAKGLQEARREYLDSHPEMGHPHFWAGYLSYGPPAKIPAGAAIPGFWIIAAVAGLILIGWLVRLH